MQRRIALHCTANCRSNKREMQFCLDLDVKCRCASEAYYESLCTAVLCLAQGSSAFCVIWSYRKQKVDSIGFCGWRHERLSPFMQC